MDGPASTDRVVRTITDDGAFRLVTLRADATARGVADAQGVSGELATLMAELVSGAILFRETMAPQLRVQCILDAPDDGARLVADAHPDGGNRGLVSLPPGRERFDLAPGTLLRMSRAMPRGQTHDGVVEVPPRGGLSEALMRYFQESEQVVAVIAVATVRVAGQMRCGGYVVQLLPEASRAALEVMTGRLARLPPLAELLEAGDDAEALTARILSDTEATRLDDKPVRFSCRCSRERAAMALAQAAPQEVREALEEQRPLETRCEFCRTHYRFELDELAALLGGSNTVH